MQHATAERQPASITAAIAGVRSLSPSRAHRRFVLALMMASGFAGLGYQIVWTQQSALWLGHESAAVLAVVAAFFGGLGLGALILGPRIYRSAHPARWYAACEAAIGLWGIALALLLAPATRGLLNLIGAQPSPVWHWTVAFCGTFLLLLPATASMGATLPAMERVMTRMRRRGETIAVLYAGNTLGAVLGVLGAAFWLVPAFGLTVTAAVCATLNLVCAALAATVFADRANAAPAGVPAAMPQANPRQALLLLSATGLLGIGYEVLVVRVLSQIAENTVYTFALLLAIYLVGTTLGAMAYARWLPRTNQPERVRDRLLQLLAAACLLSTLALAGAGVLKAWVLQLLGPSMAAALTAEAALATVAFLLPTLAMGALFSHLCTTADAAGVSFGRAIGVNTLGAAFAPLLFGVILVPTAGTKVALLLVAAGYIALSSRRAWGTAAHWTTAGALVVLALWAPSLALVEVPAGGRLTLYREGVMAAVSVVEDASGVARLHINNRQQEGSSATLLADARQALLPVLLHPAPGTALFLGMGTGLTVRSAAEDPRLQVDAVELLPEVVEASAYYASAFGAPVFGKDASDSPVHVMVADARRFVRTSERRYDVIVSDNFHPARSGSGSLYTVEHFRAVQGRLAPGGLFCQWLPLHQLDLGTLRSIVRSFRAVYPSSWALLATNSLETPVIGLIARGDSLARPGDRLLARGEESRFDAGRVRQRLASTEMPRKPAEFGIDDELALLGSFIAGPQALARFAGDAPFNTDDHPVVAYRAPRITYAPDSLPRDRLIALLRELRIDADELLAKPYDAASASRLTAYWAARNRFIEVGRDVQPTSDVSRMLAQVREPLLSVLRLSPDFRPAYDPLLRMASALAGIDAAAARSLLVQLQQAQPLRPEAALALRDLPASTGTLAQ